ncbi:hypothetical protein FKP32DRAFT_41684 [Trametes sanguinea]|nr:hypothetical protein FKP32DRAFT_41684 [Trametes sanguinea]
MAALALISTAASAAQLSTILDAPSITTGISVPASIENTPPVAQLDGATENVPTQDILDIDAIVLKAESGADDAVLIVEIDDVVDTEDERDDEAVGDDDAEDNDEDAMRRFLAFANRGRASGSGLPALLAHLSNTVEAADDADTEVAELFISGVAGVLREERETQAAVARVLEEDIQYTLRDRLLQLSAYKLAGKERLDKAATQGLTLAKLQKEKKVSRPLSRRLLKYICEKE